MSTRGQSCGILNVLGGGHLPTQLTHCRRKPYDIVHPLILASEGNISTSRDLERGKLLPTNDCIMEGSVYTNDVEANN